VWAIRSRKIHCLLELPEIITHVHKIEPLGHSTKEFLILDNSNYVWCFDVISGQVVFTIGNKEHAGITNFAVDVFGKTIACIISDGSLQLYDVETRRLYSNQLRGKTNNNIVVLTSTEQSVNSSSSTFLRVVDITAFEGMLQL
jgi:WD40 repeat protein